MSLAIAIDELRSTGWTNMDSAGCSFDADGRSYPGAVRVKQEFAAAGFELELARVDRYNCVRATWREAGGKAAGTVVGQSHDEAAVFALAQLRRSLAAAGA